MTLLHVIESIYEYFCIRTSVFCNANEFIVSHVRGRFYDVVYFCGGAGITIEPCDFIFYDIHVRWNLTISVMLKKPLYSIRMFSTSRKLKISKN